MVGSGAENWKKGVVSKKTRSSDENSKKQAEEINRKEVIR